MRLLPSQSDLAGRLLHGACLGQQRPLLIPGLDLLRSFEAYFGHLLVLLDLLDGGCREHCEVGAIEVLIEYQLALGHHGYLGHVVLLWAGLLVVSLQLFEWKATGPPAI